MAASRCCLITTPAERVKPDATLLSLFSLKFVLRSRHRQVCWENILGTGSKDLAWHLWWTRLFHRNDCTIFGRAGEVQATLHASQRVQGIDQSSSRVQVCKSCCCCFRTCGVPTFLGWARYQPARRCMHVGVSSGKQHRSQALLERTVIF